MLNENNDQYMQIVSKYINNFINDIAFNKEKVLKKLEDFPSQHHLLLKKAIVEGPDVLPKDDPSICKILYNFIEFYSTGSYSAVDVSLKDKTANLPKQM